jgi:hypothetical protein
MLMGWCIIVGILLTVLGSLLLGQGWPLVLAGVLLLLWSVVRPAKGGE